MATLTIPAPATLPAGAVIATEVSVEDYLAQYAHSFHEWVRGAVIEMSPASLKHDELTIYVRQLLNAYFELNPIGRALSAPFVMQLETTSSFRKPDVQVILTGNPGTLTDTAMLGPADICIEVVSPESVTRDYGEKFAEYEQAGVREYWIVDPVRQRCQFNRLDASGVYVVAYPDDTSHYHTPLLPRLVLPVLTLWADELPGFFAIGQSVQAMFGDHE